MLVEFSPEDIVSVPHDCGYAKLRVSQYKVIAECHDRKLLNETGVYGNNTSQYGSSHDIMWNVEDVMFEGTASFTDVQRNMPGITVNQIIDAYEEEENVPPTFEYNDKRNELVVNA